MCVQPQLWQAKTFWSLFKAQKNVIYVASDDKNEMNNTTPVPTSSELEIGVGTVAVTSLSAVSREAKGHAKLFDRWDVTSSLIRNGSFGGDHRRSFSVQVPSSSLDQSSQLRDTSQ
ncbi:hypothetical protein TNCV_3976371 [Trichonephila clavipes]|nr:hypothetical protein TNCV_3976371 [Trichonephila clavipes]